MKLNLERNHGHETKKKNLDTFRNKLRGIISSASRDCSIYQFRCATLSELEFHNKYISFIAINILVIGTIFFILMPYVCFAEAPLSIDEVIERLQQTYDKIDDFKANFAQETTVKSIKKTEKEEGIVYLKKPKNMLWNYTSPKAKKLIINARKTWLYLPSEKAAYIQESDRIFQSKVLIKFLSGLGKLKDDFTIKYAEQKTLDKNGNFLLVLTPLEKNPSLNPFQITVDKSTCHILQVSFEDTMGNSTLLKFSTISTNTGLSEKMFQFKPPAGVSIYNMP
jgi:outer membrane lipoprotein carrier protein